MKIPDLKGHITLALVAVAVVYALLGGPGLVLAGALGLAAVIEKKMSVR